MVEDTIMVGTIAVDIITIMDTDIDRVTTITMGTVIIMDVVIEQHLVNMDIIETRVTTIDIETTEVMPVTIRIHETIDITEIQSTIEATITTVIVAITEQQDLQMLDLVLVILDLDQQEEDKTFKVLLFSENLS